MLQLLSVATASWLRKRGNHTIRKIDIAGNVTTFAGSPGLTGTTNAAGTNAR